MVEKLRAVISVGFIVAMMILGGLYKSNSRLAKLTFFYTWMPWARKFGLSETANVLRHEDTSDDHLSIGEGDCSISSGSFYSPDRENKSRSTGVSNSNSQWAKIKQ